MRRASLTFATLAFCWLGLERRGGASTVEGDAQGFGGTSAGTWACGPSHRAVYGGLGADVAVRPRAADGPGEGLELRAGAAVDYRAYQLLDTNCDDPATCDGRIPSGSPHGGGRANVGWDTKYFGVRGGALVFTRYFEANDGGPKPQVLPELHLRAGGRVGVFGELGFGAYGPSTILRPGLYGGLANVFDGGLELGVRGGLHQIADSSPGVRAELRGFVPVTDRLKLGLTGAYLGPTDGPVYPGGELGAGVRWVSF